MVRDCGDNLHPRDVPPDLLINRYTPLIAKAARKMGFDLEGAYHEGMEMDDAMQAGRIALWQAAQSFEPGRMDKKFRDPFLVYAYKKIWQEISNEKRRCQWMTSSHTTAHRARHKAYRWESSEFWELTTELDVWEQIDNQEWLDRIDASIKRMNAQRRNIFQGVMRHDGFGNKSNGGNHCETWDVSSSRLSQVRVDIRKKLKAELN